MPRGGAAAVLTLVAGCDLVFRLEEVPASEVPEGCRELAVEATRDTFLDSQAPDTARGTLDVIVGGAADPLALRFPFDGDNALFANETLWRLRLTLTPQSVSAFCGTTNACEPCETQYGQWHLHWMKHRWSEARATYFLADIDSRGEDLLWDLPGAAHEPEDRSPLVGSGPAPLPGTPHVLEVDSGALGRVSFAPYLSNARLSIQLRVDGPAAFSAREAGGCQTPMPARLELVVCP
jgi:hypothetical protein